MKGFIEVTDKSERKHLINVSAIIEITKNDYHETVISLSSTVAYKIMQSYDDVRLLISKATDNP